MTYRTMSGNGLGQSVAFERSCPWAFRDPPCVCNHLAMVGDGLIARAACLVVLAGLIAAVLPSDGAAAEGIDTEVVVATISLSKLQPLPQTASHLS